MKVHNFGIAIFPLMCNYDIAHLGFYGFLCFSLLLIQIRTRRTMGSCPLWQPLFRYKYYSYKYSVSKIIEKRNWILFCSV